MWCRIAVFLAGPGWVVLGVPKLLAGSFLAVLTLSTGVRADCLLKLPNPPGSIAIDADLLDAAGIFPHEQVDVLNITNGARFTTYAIEAPRGSKVIGVNGAAARLVQKNDKVIVVTYGQMPEEEARQWSPTVVLLDDHNAIKRAA